MPGVVTSLHRYPVKSCRGEALEAAEVEPWGLAGDRRWMLVDEDGDAVTAREVHRLLLITPELTERGLRVTAPGADPLDVATPDPARQVPVAVFSSALTAAVAGPEADAWFTAVAGRPVRLVHLDDPSRRPTNPAFSEADDRVSLADGYPLLLTAEESLARLDDDVLAADGAAGGMGRKPLPMTRFRPNVVVRGFDAWAEDDWRVVRIGGVTFRAVKGCDRCVMTTLDPDTAEREHQPIRSLARIRRFDGATWFGVNLVPDGVAPGTPGARLRVGDEIEVLDAVPAGSGPLRASLLERR